jgi:uncharacterized cupredoxin-like copper-binding protein
MKALYKTLINCAFLSLLAACNTNNANQNNTSTNTLSNSPNTASSPTPAKEPSDSGGLTAGSSANSAKATATKINAVEKEMSIQLSSTTVPAGSVEFVVENQGKMPHEFVVLKNDLKDKKLPLKGDKLDEDAKGLKKIAEIGEDKLKSGATQQLKVNLTPGRYLIVCNVGDHFNKGMKTELTVK